MKEYATRSDLRGFAAKKTLAENASIRTMAKRRSPNGSTFLSHSSKDEELVDGAIAVLKGHGATVYIDEIDPDMPPYTNTETAEKLKQRIDQCKKFVMLASKNSKGSTWVPWELGIADGKKDLNRVAIFSAVENQSDTSWVSWEYLGLYHQIMWADLQGHDKPLWIVLNRRRNTGTPLSEWLKA